MAYGCTPFHFSQGLLFPLFSPPTSDLKLQKNDKWHHVPFSGESQGILEQEAVYTQSKPITGRAVGCPDPHSKLCGVVLEPCGILAQAGSPETPNSPPQVKLKA